MCGPDQLGSFRTQVRPKSFAPLIVKDGVAQWGMKGSKNPLTKGRRASVESLRRWLQQHNHHNQTDASWASADDKTIPDVLTCWAEDEKTPNYMVVDLHISHAQDDNLHEKTTTYNFSPAMWHNNGCARMHV